PSTKSQRIWRTCEKWWPTARAFVKDNKRTSLLREMGLGSKNRTLLNKIARRISKREGTVGYLNSLKAIPGIRRATDVAFAVTALSFRRPVTGAVIRLVQRFFGEVIDDSRMAAELLLGRLVGVDQDARAYVAVLEIAEGFCRPGNPDCR